MKTKNQKHSRKDEIERLQKELDKAMECCRALARQRFLAERKLAVREASCAR
jgi:hypothetical protein